jgi:hypothetical protein
MQVQGTAAGASSFFKLLCGYEGILHAVCQNHEIVLHCQHIDKKFIRMDPQFKLDKSYSTHSLEQPRWQPILVK